MQLAGKRTKRRMPSARKMSEFLTLAIFLTLARDPVSHFDQSLSLKILLRREFCYISHNSKESWLRKRRYNRV